MSWLPADDSISGVTTTHSTVLNREWILESSGARARRQDADLREPVTSVRARAGRRVENSNYGFSKPERGKPHFTVYLDAQSGRHSQPTERCLGECCAHFPAAPALPQNIKTERAAKIRNSLRRFSHSPGTEDCCALTTLRHNLAQWCEGKKLRRQADTH